MNEQLWSPALAVLLIAIQVSMIGLAVFMFWRNLRERRRMRDRARRQLKDLADYDAGNAYTDQLFRRMRDIARQFCPDCSRFDKWRNDQLCVGGCHRTIRQLREESVGMAQDWLCEPCQDFHWDNHLARPLIDRRLQAVRSKALQVNHEYHLSPTIPPSPPGAA